MKKTFKIKSDIAAVQPLVKEILGYLKERNLNNDILHDIKLSAEEALINAIKHGSRFREDLPVAVDFECSDNKVRIAVQDKGEGYDYSRIPDPTLDENIAKGSGRGVFLIKRLMDEVRFNKSGNKIEMVKYI